MAHLRSLRSIVWMLALVAGARAQDIGNVGIRTIAIPNVFNAVTSAQTTPTTCSGSPASSGGTACIQNLGQTIHLLQYKVAGSPTMIQIRLEGSWDGSNYFPISDDGTDLVQGEVLAIGYYPQVRGNLVQCIGCGGGVTLSASYSGSSMPGNNPFGFYNPGQQVRKVVFTRVSAASSQSVTGIAAPFASASGFLVLTGTSTWGSGNFTVTGHVGESAWSSTITPNSIAYQGIPIEPTAATSIDVSYSASGGSGTFSAYYVFLQPGGWIASDEPEVRTNNESTQTNASVVTTVGPGNQARAHLYSISARCSAGTAGLTVKEAGTIVWSSGTTEVGATTFRFQWSPALTSASGNALQVTLTTCGSANVGTLDVEGATY